MDDSDIFHENYKAALPGEYLKKYNDKLKLLLDEFDPYEVYTTQMTKYFDSIPYSFAAHVFEYLIDKTKAIPKEESRKFKQSDGYKFAQSGCVKDISSMFLRTSDYEKNIYFGIVKPPENDEFLKVWIATEEDGTVITGNCTCAEGISGTCSHVCAVLWKMEHIATMIDLEKNPPPWLEQGPKNYSPEEFEEEPSTETNTGLGESTSAPMASSKSAVNDGPLKKLHDIPGTRFAAYVYKPEGNPEKTVKKTQEDPKIRQERIDFLEKMWEAGQRCVLMSVIPEFANRIKEENERKKTRKRKINESDEYSSLDELW